MRYRGGGNCGGCASVRHRSVRSSGSDASVCYAGVGGRSGGTCV